MKEHLPSIMMGAFALTLVLSLWKIYKFLPNKQLEDDDNTLESFKQLTCIMLEVIKQMPTPPNHQELFVGMQSHKDFDAKHFWRFNENKLLQLLQKYYILHNLSSIKGIYETLKVTEA